jgi:succinyl-diaminopimelate desuccinylase
MDKRDYNKIIKRIDTYEDAMVELQIALTAIPAISPDNGGDGEVEKAKYISNCLNKMGFPSLKELHAFDDKVSSGVRPNLILQIPGKNDDITTWILTHMDIVPPGELNLWDENPYKGYVKNGRIYGRGTEDNQQDLVASIFASKAFMEEGIVPETSIGLAFVSDEETSSRFGLSHLMNHEENPFRKTDIILVPDLGNEAGTLIEVEEKSIFWLRFKTVGKQCHASMPHMGKNAFQAASYLVVRLNDLHHIFNDRNPFFEPPASTFQPTKKDPNIPNINTIPGKDVFFLDSRILPHYPLSEVLSEIRLMSEEIERQFGVSIEITAIQEAQAPPPTSYDAPVVLALQQAIKDVYNVKASPQGFGAGTVAAVFRMHGYPAAVWSKVTHMAHQPNENCTIANMMGNAKVFAHLFLQKPGNK